MSGQVVKYLLILIGPKLTRLALLCALPGFLFAADATHYRVMLQSVDGAVSYDIARLAIEPDSGRYQVLMKEEAFSDYFLSMRPFRCMSDSADMLCHLPYPYQLPGEISPGISDADLTTLEHHFLFIRRKPTDYGIDPWNGLYYTIEKRGDGFVGRAHEVDLNILAAPPEGDALPLTGAEMHEGDRDALWLPALVITPQ